MSKKIFIGAVIFILSVTIFSAVDAKKTSGTWRLDGTASAEMPANFRWMSDPWHNIFRGKPPTRQGLDDLHISASNQPSQAALSTIHEKILEREPDAKIFMIDLRQESHGFVNSLPVSWHIKHNIDNFGKSTSEVEAIEAERLNALRNVETTFVPLGNADKKTLKPVTIIPHFTLTEREAAEQAGMHYVRFAATDGQFPAPELVDEFVAFVATLPDNAWLHFHCQAGHGRTTSFLVMYDIMKNPELPLEEICKRQHLLGGTNLLLELEGNDWDGKNTRDRAKKIRLFYEFVQGTRAEQIGLPWSEWLEKQLGTRN